MVPLPLASTIDKMVTFSSRQMILGAGLTALQQIPFHIVIDSASDVLAANVDLASFSC